MFQRVSACKTLLVCTNTLPNNHLKTKMYYISAQFKTKMVKGFTLVLHVPMYTKLYFSVICFDMVLEYVFVQYDFVM